MRRHRYGREQVTVCTRVRRNVLMAFRGTCKAHGVTPYRALRAFVEAVSENQEVLRNMLRSR